MSSTNRKAATAALAGLLLASNASAVVLGVDPPRNFAAEIEDGTQLSDPADTISFEAGYNFSSTEIRYARVQCTANIMLDAVTVTTASTDLVPGSINGAGTNAVFFSLTATAAPGVTADDIIDIDADVTLLSGGDVNCMYSLYDYPSQAAQGASDGRVVHTGWQAAYRRPSGYVFDAVPGRPDQATIDVEALAGPYLDFTTDPALFGTVRFEAAPGVLDADGNQVTLVELFEPTTSFSIQGDYSAAQQVRAHNLVDAISYLPDIDSVDRKTFTGLLSGFDANLQYEPLGDRVIPESEFHAQLHPVPRPGYVVPLADPVKIGAVVRNGTQLQAPLVQTPGAGWLSRIVLTNSGGLDRTYEITVRGERGNAIGTANLTGILPANETLVINMDQVLVSFTPGKQRRATVNVSVAAPNHHIQGLYQIVNANDNTISNHVMVRPATN